MAQIDMKNAYIKSRDGGRHYQPTGAGKINNVAGYPTSTTVLTIDGFTSALEAGGTLEIGTNILTIVSSVGGATPTSVTVAAPGLTQAVVDDQAIAAFGKVNTLTVKVGEGTLTYSEKRNIQYTLDRGVIDEVREGDQVPMDVKFDIVWDYIKGDGAGTPSMEDALKKIGDASTWRSSDLDPCRPFCVDVIVEYIPQCTGDTEEIVLPDFRYESLDHDLKAGTISCSGKCNATQATAVRG
jgi:hypothetical protein